MKNKTISLMIMSCDKYDDVQKYFFEIWNRFVPWWKYPKYLVTEKKKYCYENVFTITSNKKSWNERLTDALEKINTDYILYLQEDYFVGNYVSEDTIENILNIIEENNLNYYKLDNYPKINNHKFDNNHISLIPNNKRYGINLLSAIIKVEWLKKQLPQGKADPWKVESNFLNNVQNKFSGYVEGCVVDTNEPFKIRYGVRHGKWWPSTINYFQKKGINIQVEPRGKNSYFRMIHENFITCIAHILPTSFIRILKKYFSLFGKKYISKM